MYKPVDKRDAITIDEARDKIRTFAKNNTTKSEIIQTDIAVGRILASDIIAPFPYPHFRRSGYDGYAVNKNDVKTLPVTLEVIGETAAGNNKITKINPGQAVRIMTGGLVPEGADWVVMLETTTAETNHVTINAIQKKDNITPIGEYFKTGQIILTKGTKLNAGGLSLLSAFNIQKVPVFKKPKVAIISTGTELLTPDKDLVAGKIYNSNGPLIHSLAIENGAEVIADTQIKDTLNDLEEKIAQYQKAADIIITTGGVSVGDFDFMAKKAREADKLFFNKLEMRPGSVTTAFIDQDTLFFGLSGNPGACFTGFYLFTELALQIMQGSTSQLIETIGILAEEYDKTNMYDRILRATFRFDEGQLFVDRVGGDASGNLNNLQNTTCLFEIKRTDTITKKDTRVRTWLLPFK